MLSKLIRSSNSSLSKRNSAVKNIGRNPRRQFYPEVYVIALAPLYVYVGSFIWARYRVSRPDEYLVRTGLGISNLKITKHGMQWPFQEHHYIKMHPKTYSFYLQGVSSDNVGFTLPGSFTIGPKDNIIALDRYAKLLTQSDEEDEDKSDLRINTIIRDVIEGEVRIGSAQITIDQIANEGQSFKRQLVENIQKELDQFGLHVYNTNIREVLESSRHVEWPKVATIQMPLYKV